MDARNGPGPPQAERGLEVTELGWVTLPLWDWAFLRRGSSVPGPMSKKRVLASVG